MFNPLRAFLTWRAQRRAFKHAAALQPAQIVAMAISQIRPTSTAGLERSLLALGNHGEDRGVFRDLPHGAIDVLAHKLYQGQMDIAAALRSVASALREQSMSQKNARALTESERRDEGDRKRGGGRHGSRS